MSNTSILLLSAQAQLVPWRQWSGMQQSWNSSFSCTPCWWIRGHLVPVTTRVSPYLHKEDPENTSFERWGRLKLSRSTAQAAINLQRPGRSKGSSGSCKATPHTRVSSSRRCQPISEGWLAPSVPSQEVLYKHKLICGRWVWNDYSHKQTNRKQK